MHRQMLHAGFVAQDRSARNTRRRVDSQHRHSVAFANKKKAQGFDEGGLTHPWHTTDTQTKRLTTVRQHRCQQGIGQHTVVVAGGLQQSNRLGHGAALLDGVTVAQGLQQLSGVLHRHQRTSNMRPSQSINQPATFECATAHLWHSPEWACPVHKYL